MKTISTTAILWPVKAIFEKRAATVEVDNLISPAICFFPEENSNDASFTGILSIGSV